MPVDREKAVGASLGERESGWEPDDVILYHLGVGAGVPPTEPGELEYAYEKNLFNLAQLLHGEQDIEIHTTLPTSATTVMKSRVADVFDKGKAALVIIENEVTDDSGDRLYTTRMSAFIRGEGGFGGPSGPKPGNQPPEREPDDVVESETLPQQALLYRLSGDKNPLHADPEFAKMAGFDQPIIHGLCSYGIVCKAIVDAALDGDPTRVARYQARFRGVGFPGETYLTSYWKEDDRIVLEVKSKQRDAPIISNAAVWLRS
jgi:acyl dehydratase